MQACRCNIELGIWGGGYKHEGISSTPANIEERHACKARGCNRLKYGAGSICSHRLRHLYRGVTVKKACSPTTLYRVYQSPAFTFDI